MFPQSLHKYKNFVRPSEQLQPVESPPPPPAPGLSGRDAQLAYLEVVSSASLDPLVPSPSTPPPPPPWRTDPRQTKQNENRSENIISNDKELFLAAQNDDHAALELHLSTNPAKLNILDDYGWSLLMIACQADSVRTVKVLLKMGVDTEIRDRAGNSANTLLIKQRNVRLIDIMMNHSKKLIKKTKSTEKNKLEPLQCKECNKSYRDRREHISSTEHNINVSKNKKKRTWYGIPETNRGFQILVKSGWDRENGLGPEGSGKKYPIKPLVKQDRKGLGAVKNKVLVTTVEEKDVIKNKRVFESDYRRDKRIERDFRREFYDFSY